VGREKTLQRREGEREGERIRGRLPWE